MEITENDVVDAVEQKAPVKFIKAPNQATVGSVVVDVKPGEAKATPPKPTTGPWSLSVADNADVDVWMDVLSAGCDVLLAVAESVDDVATIFKTNRSVFDKAKSLDETAYAKIMEKFSATKKSLTKA
jgi:hypothetical protein